MSFGATTNTTVEISNSLDGTNPFEVKLSDMDGAVIDWNPNDYTKIVNNPDIQSIAELNKTGDAGNFDFNAILIYYDVFDVSSPNQTKRNLYGILVIDDFEETLSDGAKLKSFSKFVMESESRALSSSKNCV